MTRLSFSLLLTLLLALPVDPAAAASPPSLCARSFKASVNAATKLLAGPDRSVRGLAKRVTVIAAALGAEVGLVDIVQREHQGDAVAGVALASDAALSDPQRQLFGNALRWELSTLRAERTGMIDSQIDQALRYWHGVRMARLLRIVDARSDGLVTRSMATHGIEPRLMSDSQNATEFEALYSHQGGFWHAYFDPLQMQRRAALDRVLGDVAVWAAAEAQKDLKIPAIADHLRKIGGYDLNESGQRPLVWWESVSRRQQDIREILISSKDYEDLAPRVAAVVERNASTLTGRTLSVVTGDRTYTFASAEELVWFIVHGEVE